MTEKTEANNTNKESIFTFRFGTSDKLVHLSQQLDYIPYLAALVAHKDDMPSIQNQNGEFVLNSPICYNLFTIILRSVNLDQPYILFTDLPEHENVLDILHLYDYLCINTLPVPILKGNLSNHSNINDESIPVEYRRAYLLEKRDTAARFLITLSKNKYNLDDYKIVGDIFSSVMSIFSTPDVFNLRFRYHTLTIIKQYCFPLFSQKQQRRLPTAQQIIQENSNYSSKYSYYNDQNAFDWRAVYIPTEEKNSDHLFEHSQEISHLKSHPILWLDRPLPSVEKHLLIFMQYFMAVCRVSEKDEEQGESEAKSARSGRFNTLPKRPNVDKVKHRCGAKAQKYR